MSTQFGNPSSKSLKLNKIIYYCFRRMSQFLLPQATIMLKMVIKKVWKVYWTIFHLSRGKLQKEW